MKTETQIELVQTFKSNHSYSKLNLIKSETASTIEEAETKMESFKNEVSGLEIVLITEKGGETFTYLPYQCNIVIKTKPKSI